MKAKRFFAFILAIGALLSIGCTKEQPLNDISPAVISVTPTRHAVTLSGGEVTFELTTNGSWSVKSDATDIILTPSSGSGNGTITATIPNASVARNILLSFSATKQSYITGIEYTSRPAVADVLIFQNETGEAKRTTNVKTIRDLLKKGPLSSEKSGVSSEVAKMSITGVVVGAYNASGTYGNMSFDGMYAIQDDSGKAGAGLTLICENKGSNQIPFGQVVTVSLDKATVQLYNGVMQLDVNSEVTLLDEPIEVTPTPIAVADIIDYESQYIVIEECQPTADVRGLSFEEKYNPYFEVKTGEKFTVYANKNAAIRSYTIPAKSGSVAGLAYRYNDSAEIMPCRISDLQLTEELFEIEGFKVNSFDEIKSNGKYSVTEVTAVGVSTKSYVIMDSKGAMMLVYTGSNPLDILAIGDKGSIAGTVSEYGGVKQFSASVFTKSGTAEATLTPTELDATAFDALYNSIKGIQYVQYTGKLTKNASGYYEVAPANATHKSTIHNPIQNIVDIFEKNIDKYIIISGFALYIDHDMINIIADNVTTATISAIVAEDISVEAEGVTNAEATIELENIQDAVIATYDGVVVTNAKVEGTTLIYSVSENTSDTAREGWIKLTAGDVETTIKVSQSKYADSTESASYYELTLSDMKAISYSSSWSEWSTTAADGSVWSGYAYKNSSYYQLSFNKTDSATEKSGRSHILTPATPEGKTISKITITPDGKTSNNRYLVALPADFAYTSSPNASVAKEAAYGISAATVKESTTPLVIDLTGKNISGQVQIRTIEGAAYITNIKVEFE